MRPYDFNRPASSSSATSGQPRACPRCAAASIVSTDKAPRADSYWRCEQCGEVWSPARRTEPGRPHWR